MKKKEKIIKKKVKKVRNDRVAILERHISLLETRIAQLEAKENDELAQIIKILKRDEVKYPYPSPNYPNQDWPRDIDPGFYKWPREPRFPGDDNHIWC